MAYKKFKDNEILLNTMRSYPDVSFFIVNGNVFFNSTPAQSGNRNSTVRNVPVGHISLYESNIDRPLVSTGRHVGIGPSKEGGSGDLGVPDNGRIYPWISKDSAGSSFKTVGKTSYATEFNYGDVLASKYPLSASITREYVATPSSSSPAGAGAYNARYMALRNRLNFYGGRSPHYLVSSSLFPRTKNDVPLNFVHIPSIFYGTRIKPGSVRLKWFFTGSLAGELKDINKNGELIQVTSSGDGAAYNEKVAGVVLYEEGIILLTGSWELNHSSMDFGTAGASKPKWIHFGAGGNDGNTIASAGSTFNSGSYEINFKGTNDTQVMTMFAHAKRGEVNYSNNASYIEYGQQKIFKTSSNIYHENNELKIKNFTSSSFIDHSSSFKRQVYISKVAIYDKSRNLIGVATLGSPLLKEENQSYTFKLKLDI